MKAEDFRVEAADLASAHLVRDRQVGWVDLDALPHDARIDTLPFFPLIGVGDSKHPAAGCLDCVIEPPFELDRVLASVLAKPKTAAVFVGLLRSIEEVDQRSAIVAESLAFSTLQGSDEHREWLEARAAGQGAEPGEVIVTRDDNTLIVTVSRAAAANAVDATIRDALKEAFDLAVADDTISRVELRGEGKAFGVGADLSEFGTTRDPAQAHLIRMQTLPALAAIGCVDRLHAFVQGLCVGSSLELAAYASRIVATRNAVFQLPELKMGILPGAGGCVSLSRRIGRQRAALMVLSGRRVSAVTALEWGLVDELVDELPPPASAWPR